MWVFDESGEEHMSCFCEGIFHESEGPTQKQRMCSPTQTDQTWTCSWFYYILPIIKSQLGLGQLNT